VEICYTLGWTEAIPKSIDSHDGEPPDVKLSDYEVRLRGVSHPTRKVWGRAELIPPDKFLAMRHPAQQLEITEEQCQVMRMKAERLLGRR
jgi:hypothetical protein